MTTEIKEFSTGSAGEWMMFENTIREALEKAGASQEMVQEVSARMKQVFEKYDRKFTLALSPPLAENLSTKQRREIDNSIRNAIEELTNEIHEYTSEVLLDRLFIEIELYKLRSRR